eukprot:symbB.v1.2.012842.t1/scaffold887.1/size155094/9
MSSEELGLPSFLVGDVLIRHPDLVGLDSPAELFAVDAPEAQSAPRLEAKTKTDMQRVNDTSEYFDDF